MPRFNWFLSFAEITFPVSLLIPDLLLIFPTVIVSPREIGVVYLVIVVEYIGIVSAIVYSLFEERLWLTLGVLHLFAVLVGIALFYVIKLTTQAYINRYFKFLEDAAQESPV